MRDVVGEWIVDHGLLSVALLVGFFAVLVGWGLYADAHDGQRCVKQEFSHHQLIGKVLFPMYRCTEYVDAPEERR